MERIHLQENTAKAFRRKCEFDQVREVPFVRKADKLALATNVTSHLVQSSSASRLALDRKASYAAQARVKASACSPGKVPLADLTSSRVCLPPSSSINESSHCASGGLIVTVRRSGKSVIRN